MTEFVALISALLFASALGVSAYAAPTSKPYTATWVSGGTALANPLPVPAGSATLTLRITNKANPQALGSANIRPPDGYTLTGVLPLTLPATAALDTSTNTVKLRNLNLAPLGTVDVTVDVTTACLADGVAKPWELIVKQANSFSGPPGNDFVIQPADAYPSTVRAIGSACRLRFATEPDTTKTGAIITDGFDSTGDAITVEIFDPSTGDVVDSNAEVTLTPGHNPAAGTLVSGGPVQASAGVATFPDLSIGTPGPYTLVASSPAASNTPETLQFMVSDTLEECAGTGCTFTLPQGQNTYTTTPKKGASGATFVASLNLSGMRVSCDFAPFNYPDSRQPNAVWYVYDDGNTGSAKTNTIVIDKAIVQVTPENGASAYRVCYSSPDPFLARTGAPAAADPWTDGPTAYFGITWYTGLLPDCAKKNPVAPCVVSWTGTGSGNRVGTFLTPPGDPSYR